MSEPCKDKIPLGDSVQTPEENLTRFRRGAARDYVERMLYPDRFPDRDPPYVEMPPLDLHSTFYHG